MKDSYGNQINIGDILLYIVDGRINYGVVSQFCDPKILDPDTRLIELKVNPENPQNKNSLVSNGVAVISERRYMMNFSALGEKGIKDEIVLAHLSQWDRT